MNVIGLSEEHENNLRKLAAGLRKFNEELNFDMNELLAFEEKNDLGLIYCTCGTPACALGHATHLVEPADEVETLCWQYSLRLFGFASDDKCWNWLFSDRWSEIDDTPTGAASRIDYLLDKGCPPIAFIRSTYRGYVSPQTKDYDAYRTEDTIEVGQSQV